MADGLGQQEIQTTIASAFKGAAGGAGPESETTRSLNYTRKGCTSAGGGSTAGNDGPHPQAAMAAFEKGKTFV